MPPPRDLELKWLEGGHSLGAASVFEWLIARHLELARRALSDGADVTPGA